MPCDIDQLIRDAQMLPPEQRARLRQALDEPEEAAVHEAPPPLAADPQAVVAIEYQRRLLAAGLISKIKPPLPDTSVRGTGTPFRTCYGQELDAPVSDAWTPITIQGKPLSETIIEERR